MPVTRTSQERLTCKVQELPYKERENWKGGREGGGEREGGKRGREGGRKEGRHPCA